MYQLVSNDLSHLKNVCYFSDGSCLQYMNCKNFLKLCYNEGDFCVAAEWKFFVASCGRSVCDGISGTVKPGVACGCLHHI